MGRRAGSSPRPAAATHAHNTFPFLAVARLPEGEGQPGVDRITLELLYPLLSVQIRDKNPWYHHRAGRYCQLSFTEISQHSFNTSHP